MNKKLKYIFTLSVILNLLLAGVLIGYGIKRAWIHHSGAECSGCVHIQKLIDGFPESKRENFQEKLSFVSGKRQENEKELRELRGQLFEILKAPTFDDSSYKEIATRIIVLKNESEKLHTGFIQELSIQLPQEERRKLGLLFRNC